MNGSSQKILIIRLSSIGDVLLTTPFIRQTRKTFPKAQIDYIIKEEYVELLEMNPNIDNLLTIDTKTGSHGLRELKKSLLEIDYDYVFDLHNNFRSNYLKRGLRTEHRYTIKKNKIIQFLYVYFKINWYEKIIPMAERYLAVGKSVGIEDDGIGLELYWRKSLDNSVKNVFDKIARIEKDRFFTFAPGAGFFTKRWPVEYYKRLIKDLMDKYSCKVLILGSELDNRQGKYLAENENVFDLTGQLSLLQSAIVISKSKALVTNDTGLMHMATAVKTPLLAIFGSTVKEFGFFPYRSKSVIVENEGLSCRPCSHIGRHSCPKKHFKCMKELTPDIVMRNFEKIELN